jgi:hypothetical protein
MPWPKISKVGEGLSGAELGLRGAAARTVCAKAADRAAAQVGDFYAQPGRKAQDGAAHRERYPVGFPLPEVHGQAQSALRAKPVGGERGGDSGGAR